MRDEAYRRDQIPAYGATAQPALVERMRPLLRMSQIGNALAVVAVLVGLVGLLTYSDFDGFGHGWAVASFVASVALLAVCTFQHQSWTRAMAIWEGRGTGDLGQISRLSFLAQFAAYLLIAFTVVSTILAVTIASWAATASILLLVSLVVMIAAQVLAGVQYVRASGPPGALPTHMHKAIKSQQRR